MLGQQVSVMRNHGCIGGDNASWTERRALIAKYLEPRVDKAVDFGSRGQCRCGCTCKVLWRRRWYCVRCGQWLRQPVSDIYGMAERSKGAYGR